MENKIKTGDIVKTTKGIGMIVEVVHNDPKVDFQVQILKTGNWVCVKAAQIKAVARV